MAYSSLPQDVVLCDGVLLTTSCLLLSWACLRLNENSVSPPSNQHLASGAGKFSQRIQSLASLSACPLMHFAYMICSFKSGSPGLTLGEAIFGIKNLHQGTVVYLPCSGLMLLCLMSSLVDYSALREISLECEWHASWWHAATVGTSFMLPR